MNLLFVVFALVLSRADADDMLNGLMATKAIYEKPTNMAAAVPASCNARHVALFARHGARFPVVSLVLRSFAHSRIYLFAVAHSLNTRVCFVPTQTSSNVASFSAFAETLHANSAAINATFRNWTSPFDEESAGQLSAFGAQQTYELAKRMLQAFPSAFERLERVHIRASAVSRAFRTASTFAFALFENRGVVGGANSTNFVATDIATLPKDADMLLRSFDNCQQYRLYKTSCCNNDVKIN